MHWRGDPASITRWHIACPANTDPRASIFCKGMITMAHELGMRVIADGVRLDHQAQFLTMLGCDAVQRESSVDGPGSSARGENVTTSMLQPQLASGGRLKGSQPRPEGAVARLPGHQHL
ncbi:MAG: hypothetical protein CMD83_03990 [Gammaproteobacteria bacterium]|nr:hypothetical protein [Gammaproteobacteria bacterium]